MDLESSQWVPIKHSEFHFLLALLAMHGEMRDDDLDPRKVVDITRGILAAEDAMGEDGLEQLTSKLLREHAKVCGVVLDAPPEGRRLAQVTVDLNKMRLLLVYEALAAAAATNNVAAVVITKEQLMIHTRHDPITAKELQKELHVAAQSAFGDELEIALL